MFIQQGGPMNSDKEVAMGDADQENIKKVIDAGAEFVKAILPFAMSAFSVPEEEPIKKKRKKIVKKSLKKKLSAKPPARNIKKFESNKKIADQFTTIDPPQNVENPSDTPA
jgi:hypothetical protein